MKTQKVEWYSGEAQSLNQAVSTGIEFSFVSQDNKQISPFMYCKDYLQDAIHGHLNQTKNHIYGFTYDPASHHPVYLEKIKLLVANSSDKQFKEKAPNSLEFLNQIESHLGFKKTSISLCEEPTPLPKYSSGGILLFEGSRRWMKSPPLISMYSLLIRLSFGHTIGNSFKTTINGVVKGDIAPYQSVDKARLKAAMNGLKSILEFGDRKIFGFNVAKNYPKNIPIHEMHNDSGIIGFSCNKTQARFPSWHKLLDHSQAVSSI